MMIPAAGWIGFNVFVLLMLALDLGVLHRRSHAVGAREALLSTAVWIALAMIFNAGVYHYMGRESALEFLTGYLIEKALSVDNIMVFLMIFSHFKVPAAYQHRVLFWGVLGALGMRAALIAAGAAILEAFHWVFYIFGAFLIFTGIKTALHTESPLPMEGDGFIARLQKKAATGTYEGDHFFVRDGWRITATPLLLVLVVIEFTDLIFALDSIPAIFAVTRKPFIVYTSNVFAILGLRSLYFALAGLIDKFRYLKLGLAAVLVFVGVKMCLMDHFKIPIAASLAGVGLLLGASIAASLVASRREANG
jgi:tellurite resistance protein TerC